MTTLSFVIALGVAGGVNAQQTDEVEAVQTASQFQMKRCVNMGNALEAPKDASWGRLYSKEDYDRVAKAGLDTVRIPVRWSDYTGPAPDFGIDPEFMALVDQNLKWAQDAGLNVILNIHHFEEIMEDPEGQMLRYGMIWDQLSKHYAEQPENVWFEVLNEPFKNLKGTQMRRAQTVGLTLIRNHNPDRIVILGGEEWSGIRTLATNLATDDPNVVYTFHYYDPFPFTHQEATWLGDDMPKGKRGWGSKADKAELAAAVDTATAFRDAIKRPVFLGEFGVNSPVDNKERVKWAGAVSAAMEGADIPWCLWSYGNTFALYDNERGFDQSMLKALTGE
ncbi:glycoside hydrolase family 5 protein [Erythrobacter sp. F6033]|uniref:glycoside hydrolase family 5 protein n=1 Tax=Erythrobacter sp. F6033 TaxID=2926401 RepID=UPI001FF6528E|nr:glycoside hydrolase family 5 protein [Erythrobacter sp. F6033]MCK0127632.1 glycoside hydrolase family 5 protein [Erythrobacter sp. F6033]